MNLHKYAAIHGTTREQEAEYHLPTPPPTEEEIEEEENNEPTQQERAAAQSSIQDFTRNIQRKKERELAELQFVGGDGTGNGQKQAINNSKVGRNDPCPCGSGKKYKKCHGQAA